MPHTADLAVNPQATRSLHGCDGHAPRERSRVAGAAAGTVGCAITTDPCSETSTPGLAVVAVGGGALGRSRGERIAEHDSACRIDP